MITKKLFIETIEAIKKQVEHDRKCAEAIQEVYTSAFKANLLYDNITIINQTIKLLQVIFNDDYLHSWIDYFIWDNDFGRKDLKAYRKDGSEVDLSTPGALYDFLIENLKP